jgi:hypothetical protein
VTAFGAPSRIKSFRDPSGTAEINEMIGADFTVRKGRNAMRLGIAAVTARLENGTLRVVEGACPNLLREAGLYRYATKADSRRGESPLGQDDHVDGRVAVFDRDDRRAEVGAEAEDWRRGGGGEGKAGAAAVVEVG